MLLMEKQGPSDSAAVDSLFHLYVAAVISSHKSTRQISFPRRYFSFHDIDTGFCGISKGFFTENMLSSFNTCCYKFFMGTIPGGHNDGVCQGRLDQLMGIVKTFHRRILIRNLRSVFCADIADSHNFRPGNLIHNNIRMHPSDAARSN